MGFNSNSTINMKLFRLCLALLLTSSSTVLTTFANPLAAVVPRQDADPTPTPSNPFTDTRQIQSFVGSRTSSVPTTTGTGKPKGPVTVTVDVFNTPTPAPANNSILSNRAAAAGIFTAVGLVMAICLGVFGVFLYRRMHPKPKETKPIPRKYPKSRTDASSAFSSFYAPNDRSTTGTRSNLGGSHVGGSTRAGSSFNHGNANSRRDDDTMSEVARTVRDGPSLDIQRRLEGNYIPPSPMNPTRPESDPFTTQIDVYDLPFGSPPQAGPGSGRGGSEYSSYPLRAPGSNSDSYNARRGPMSEVSDKNAVVSNWLATSTTNASASAKPLAGRRHPDEESDIGSSRI